MPEGLALALALWSLGPAARFVVDHAPCRVLLIWPDVTPPVTTIPPAPDSRPPRG